MPTSLVGLKTVAAAASTVSNAMGVGKRPFSQLANIDTETICDVPGLRPESESPAESLCVRLLGNNATYSVPFGSEAGLFQCAGLSTVICGPGEIAQAHRPDEFIETSQIEACEQFMRRLGAHLSAPTV